MKNNTPERQYQHFGLHNFKNIKIPHKLHTFRLNDPKTYHKSPYKLKKKNLNNT